MSGSQLRSKWVTDMGSNHDIILGSGSTELAQRAEKGRPKGDREAMPLRHQSMSGSQLRSKWVTDMGSNHDLAPPGRCLAHYGPGGNGA